MTELQRFISLFDQEIRHTMDYLERVGEGQWRAIPLDSDALSLGNRVNKITISALTRHLLNAERHWIAQIPAIPAGGIMSLPGKADWLDTIADGADLIACYRANHGDNLGKLDDLSPDSLAKELVFHDRRYTVIGFLWSMLGHHAYHLGQIDLLMRQQATDAPEYMDWPETGRVLG